MIVSELIGRLQRWQDEKGDLPVYYNVEVTQKVTKHREVNSTGWTKYGGHEYIFLGVDIKMGTDEQDPVKKA